MSSSVKFYHFKRRRPVQNLVLGAINDRKHVVLGNVAQYLTNFQLDAVRFLFKHFQVNERGCILNDENGLGKIVSVVAFLDAVFGHGINRKKSACLIIVSNKDQIKAWKFHLATLTRINFKVIEDTSVESNFGNSSSGAFLIELSTLRKFHRNLTAVDNFRYIILDNRKEATVSNARAVNFLPRNFTGKISLILASTDLTLNLNLLHSLLKVCGRLESCYSDKKNFLEKFQIPKLQGFDVKQSILETYFLGREKIINYCRDFRLRRYSHQCEDELPLVKPEIFAESLKQWQEAPNCKSLSLSPSSSSGSLKLLSSESLDDNKTIDDLLKIMRGDTDTDNDRESSVINTKNHANELSREPSDVITMSPLLFESSSDSEELCRSPAHSPSEIENTVIEVPLEERKSVANRSRKNLSLKKVEHNSASQSEEPNMRITRSKTKQSKTDFNLNVTEKIKQQKKPNKPSNDRVPLAKANKTSQPKVNNESDDVIPETQKERIAPKVTIPMVRLHRHAFAKPFYKFSNSCSDPKYDFNLDLDDRLLAVSNQSSEPRILTHAETEKVIVLSSSSGSETIVCNSSTPVLRRKTVRKKTVKKTARISPSPDLFDSSPNDYDLLYCTQLPKASNPFKIFGSELYKTNSMIRKSLNIPSLRVARTKTSDDSKTPTNSIASRLAVEELDGANIFEITENAVFSNCLKIDSNSEVCTQRPMLSQRFNGMQRNKITKYFIDGAKRIRSNSKSPTEVSDNEILLTTPDKTIKFSSKVATAAKFPSTSKRSPNFRKNRSSTSSSSTSNVTPSRLTKWLSKNKPKESSATNANASNGKNPKRRKLELSFPTEG